MVQNKKQESQESIGEDETRQKRLPDRYVMFHFFFLTEVTHHWKAVVQIKLLVNQNEKMA